MQSLETEWRKLIVDPTHFTKGLKFPDPGQIRIYDTTLRDGEQMPGVALSPIQKRLLATEIARLGCHILDLGFPTISESEREAFRQILEAKRSGEIPPDVELLVMCRANPRDIETTCHAVRKAGAPPDAVTYLIFTSASPLHCKYKLGPTLMSRAGLNPRDLCSTPVEFFQAQNRLLLQQALDCARSHGITRVEFGCEDASRTPLPMLLDLVRTAVEGSACRFIFADTAGCLTPSSATEYCSALTAAFPEIERATHFHNDFGLATANVIAGLLAGFPIFSTTVNGIGERAGNAPLHAVVTALRYLYGIEIPGFRYDLLVPVSRLVEETTGAPVSSSEPVVGYNAFAHESGIHVHGVTICRQMYEPIPFRDVGGKPWMAFGKHSGGHGIYNLLVRESSRISGPVTLELAQGVLARVKQLREAMACAGSGAAYVARHRRHMMGLGVSPDEIVAIANDLYAVDADATIDAHRRDPLEFGQAAVSY